MRTLLFALVAVIFISCSANEIRVQADFETVQDSTSILFSVEGLNEPEAVRFDKDQQVYFISNFNGRGNDQDANGFITKVDTEGNVIDREFMVGTEEFPFHAPRGMYIEKNELWVADVLGVHVFDTNTGEQLNFVDFSSFEPGFLNDVSGDGSGVIFVTDTGKPIVYKIENNIPEVFLDSLPIYPNGITFNLSKNEFVLAPWRGDSLFYSFNILGDLKVFDEYDGSFFDGLEFVDGTLMTTSQSDQSIRIKFEGKDKILIHTMGRPADIGIDKTNKIIAVPYIALDKVDFWNFGKNADSGQ